MYKDSMHIESFLFVVIVLVKELI